MSAEAMLGEVWERATPEVRDRVQRRVLEEAEKRITAMFQVVDGELVNAETRVKCFVALARLGLDGTSGEKEKGARPRRVVVARGGLLPRGAADE